MGKLVFLMNVSLDGYIEARDRSHDWASNDDELFDFFIDRLRSTEASIYGRRLFEVMNAHWPTVASNPAATEPMLEYGRIWNAKPKVVVSRTLQAAPPGWRLASGDPEAILAELRRDVSGDVEIAGPTVAAGFIERGLVDEYQLVVHPAIVGGGRRFFPDLDRPVGLRLVETRTFSLGRRLPPVREARGQRRLVGVITDRPRRASETRTGGRRRGPCGGAVVGTFLVACALTLTACATDRPSTPSSSTAPVPSAAASASASTDPLADLEPVAGTDLPLAGRDGAAGLVRCGDVGPTTYAGLTAGPVGAERLAGPEYDVLRATIAQYGDDPEFALLKAATFREFRLDARTVRFLGDVGGAEGPFPSVTAAVDGGQLALGRHGRRVRGVRRSRAGVGERELDARWIRRAPDGRDARAAPARHRGRMYDARAARRPPGAGVRVPRAGPGARPAVRPRDRGRSALRRDRSTAVSITLPSRSAPAS